MKSKTGGKGTQLYRCERREKKEEINQVWGTENEGEGRRKEDKKKE